MLAGDQLGPHVDLTGKMPWYEAAVRVVVCLSKAPSKGGLCCEVHIAEEQLSGQTCWWLGHRLLGLLSLFHNLFYFMVEVPAAERTEV